MLFLSHRIPYPPNKGDKIRSWHILRHLSEHYRVLLGCFIDDPADWQFASVLRERCAECCFVPLKPAFAKWRSLRGFVTGAPLTLPYYRDGRLFAWVKEVAARRKPKHLFIYCSAMAQYSEAAEGATMRSIIDFVDVDSDKWRQYALRSRWPLDWVYRREHQALLRAEREAALRFDTSLLASDAEAALFRQLVPEAAHKIVALSNGVDCDFFSPDHALPNPYEDSRNIAVFTGAMDYRANIDAVLYFADDVLPHVRRDIPDVVFYIVGSRPTRQVLELGRREGIVVTGGVSDVRPYLAHAKIAVAPLRIARGIQNKVLEAMAMARPVAVTEQALEGIKAEVGKEVLLATTTGQFIDIVSRAMIGAGYDWVGKFARQRMLSDFDWRANLARLDKALANRPISSAA